MSKPNVILFVAPVMLVAGLSMGAGIATLYWSSVADRGLRRTGETMEIAKKFEEIAKQNLQIAQRNQTGWNECLQLVDRRSH